MYIIVGLGNPDKEYANTRHNIGFDVIDEIAERAGISVDTKKFKALYGTGRIEGQKVILAKPLTYMNRSGDSIRELVDYHKIDPESELIVICDDINLEEGQLRIREKGSAGGHNGLKSVIACLGGSNAFIRIRVGVGAKPSHYDLADYVLGHFSKEDRAVMEDTVRLAADAAAELTNTDAGSVMSKYNRKITPKGQKDE